MAVRHAARLHPRRHPPGFSSSERGPGEGAAGNVKDGADSWSPAAALIGGAAGPPATAASEGVVTLTIFIPILGRSWKQQRKPSSVAVSGRVPDQLRLSSFLFYLRVGDSVPFLHYIAGFARAVYYVCRSRCGRSVERPGERDRSCWTSRLSSIQCLGNGELTI